MRKPICLIAILTVFIYCGPKQEQAQKTMENGVEVVLNHLDPYKNAGEPSALHLEEEFTIDTEGDAMAERGLVGMSDFNVDSNGNIYIMQRQTSGDFIYKFDNQGNFVTSFCRKGQGPGEAGWGGDILIDENDRIIAKDMTKEKFFTFSPDGELINETTMAKNYDLIEYLGDRRYFVYWQEYDGEEQIYRNHFGMSSGQFEEMKEFYAFEFRNRLSAEKYIPVYRGLVLTATREHFYTANYQAEDRYEILVFDMGGKLVKKIRKDYIHVGISDEYKSMTKKMLERPSIGQELLKKLYFPSHWPPNRYLFTDDEGRLYVMTYEKGIDEREYMYDIFDADGVFFGRVSLGNIQIRYVGNEKHYDDPKRVRVRGDHLYFIREKENGFMELVVCRMNWE